MVCPFVGMRRVRFSKTLSLYYMLRELEENAYVFLFVVVQNYSFDSILIWFCLTWIFNVSVRCHMICSSLWEVLTLCSLWAVHYRSQIIPPKLCSVLGPGVLSWSTSSSAARSLIKSPFRWAEGILKLFLIGMQVLSYHIICAYPQWFWQMLFSISTWNRMSKQ